MKFRKITQKKKKKTVGIEICHTVEMVYILKLD